MRSNYAEALYKADGATLDDLRETVETLEDSERISQRVLGSSHPYTLEIERHLSEWRAALRAEAVPSRGA